MPQHFNHQLELRAGAGAELGLTCNGQGHSGWMCMINALVPVCTWPVCQCAESFCCCMLPPNFRLRTATSFWLGYVLLALYVMSVPGFSLLLLFAYTVAASSWMHFDQVLSCCSATYVLPLDTATAPSRNALKTIRTDLSSGCVR